MTASDIVFMVCAVVAVTSAVLVVTRRNPVYSALFMMVCFFTLAVLFLLLDAAFLAAMHVMVYTGAILVLFLFVIMLLNLKTEELGREFPPLSRRLAGIMSAALMAGLLVPLLIQRDVLDEVASVPKGFGSVEQVGDAMFNQYLLPFELLSVLILVAIFGGVILAKRKL